METEKKTKAERREEGEQELIQWSPFADGVNLTASDSVQQCEAEDKGPEEKEEEEGI
jgi:hypothetical protein